MKSRVGECMIILLRLPAVRLSSYAIRSFVVCHSQFRYRRRDIFVFPGKYMTWFSSLFVSSDASVSRFLIGCCEDASSRLPRSERADIRIHILT